VGAPPVEDAAEGGDAGGVRLVRNAQQRAVLRKDDVPTESFANLTKSIRNQPFPKHVGGAEEVGPKGPPPCRIYQQPGLLMTNDVADSRDVGRDDRHSSGHCLNEDQTKPFSH